MSKSIWQSKTFWTNLLAAIAATGTALYNTELISQFPKTAALIASVLGIVNIGLRLITSEPIE